MDAAGWKTAKEILAEALRRPRSEREAFVRARCADPELCGEIMSLVNDGAADVSTGGPQPLDEPGYLDDLQPGTRVGPYVIIDCLGRGGMGQVFLGHDPALRRKVALKCLIASRPDAGSDRARILREARAAAGISHPNIATVHHVIEHESRAFIVMEYVEGESLRVHLNRERLPMNRIVAIGVQLAGALSAAHAKGVVHRDLKPGNIQLRPDGSVKVLDFGVARAPRLASRGSTGVSTVMGVDTASVGKGGTPQYMSPEQLLGRDVDVRSDIYSLGVVLFEMATGRRPLSASSPEDLVIAQATSAPRADALDRRIPRAVADVIAKALEVDAALRFQTAAALGAALEAVEERKPGDEPIPRTLARVVFGLLLGPAVLGGVGFITTAGFNLTFGRTGPLASEPLWMYFIWGFRDIFPSALTMTMTTAIVLAGRFALRLAELVGPIGRTMSRWRTRGREIASRVGLDQPTVLSQALTVLAIATLGAVCWYHADLITAWAAFTDTSPADVLWPLRLENTERLWYRLHLDLITLAFGFGLFRVIQLRTREKTRDGKLALVMLTAMIAVMLLMNALPYRTLIHRDFERVDFGGARCYITGESAEDFLIFCPGNDPPRNRTVRRIDSNLRRLGVVENVFKGLKPSR